MMAARLLLVLGVVAMATPALAQGEKEDCATPAGDPVRELILTHGEMQQADRPALPGARQPDRNDRIVGDLSAVIGAAADKAGIGPAGLMPGPDGLFKRDDVLIALLDGKIDFPQLRRLAEQGRIKMADYHIINVILQSSPEDYVEVAKAPLPFDPRPRILAGDPAFPNVHDIEITAHGLRVLSSSPDGAFRLSTYRTGRPPIDQPLKVGGRITGAELAQLDGVGGEELVLEVAVDGARKVYVFEENERGFIATMKHAITATDDTPFMDLAADPYIFADLDAPAEPAPELSTDAASFQEIVEVQELMLQKRFGENAELHFVDYGNDGVPDAFVRTDDGVYFVRGGDLNRTLAWNTTELDPAPDAPKGSAPIPARLGRVLSVGDANGDGVEDFAFTAETADHPQDVWIFYGKP